MRSFIIFLTFLLAGALYHRHFGSSERQRAKINYREALKSDEESPKSLNYALKKITRSQKSRQGIPNRFPASLVTESAQPKFKIDTLHEDMRQNPDEALEFMRSLVDKELTNEQRNLVLMSLLQFPDSNPELSAVALEHYRAQMRTGQMGKLDRVQLQAQVLAVVLNRQIDTNNALTDTMNIANVENEPDVRYYVFQSFIRRFPEKRAELMRQLSSSDIEFARTVREGARNRKK